MSFIINCYCIDAQILKSKNKISYLWQSLCTVTEIPILKKILFKITFGSINQNISKCKSGVSKQSHTVANEQIVFSNCPPKIGKIHTTF